MPGVASAFYRVLFASIVLIPYLLFSRTTSSKTSCSNLYLALLGGAFFAGDLGLYNIAVLRTTAGSATFLGNNAPVLVGLSTWLITRKAPTARFWIALTFALCGAWLIVAVDAHHLAFGQRGDSLAMLASAFFALYVVVTGRLRESWHPASLLAVSTSASTIVLLLVAISFHVSLIVPSASSFAALLGLGLVCQVIGYFCLTYALGHLPTTMTSVLLLAVAPLTAIFALILFGERMTMWQLLGGALVLIGVWIASTIVSPRNTLNPT